MARRSSSSTERARSSGDAVPDMSTTATVSTARLLLLLLCGVASICGGEAGWAGSVRGWAPLKARGTGGGRGRKCARETGGNAQQSAQLEALEVVQDSVNRFLQRILRAPRAGADAQRARVPFRRSHSPNPTCAGNAETLPACIPSTLHPPPSTLHAPRTAHRAPPTTPINAQRTHAARNGGWDITKRRGSSPADRLKKRFVAASSSWSAGTWQAGNRVSATAANDLRSDSESGMAGGTLGKDLALGGAKQGASV